MIVTLTCSRKETILTRRLRSPSKTLMKKRDSQLRKLQPRRQKSSNSNKKSPKTTTKKKKNHSIRRRRIKPLKSNKIRTIKRMLNKKKQKLTKKKILFSKDLSSMVETANTEDSTDTLSNTSSILKLRRTLKKEEMVTSTW